MSTQQPNRAPSTTKGSVSQNATCTANRFARPISCSRQEVLAQKTEPPSDVHQACCHRKTFFQVGRTNPNMICRLQGGVGALALDAFRFGRGSLHHLWITGSVDDMFWTSSASKICVWPCFSHSRTQSGSFAMKHH